MEKRRCILALIMGILFTVVLAGCLSTAGNNQPENNTPTKKIQAETTFTPLPTLTPDPTNRDTPEIKNEIIIYTLNPSTLEKVAVTVNTDTSDFSLEDLVKKITDALEDESFLVSVKSAYFEKTVAIVDFSKNGAPGNGASAYETTVLDCISQSIMENYDECTAVIFRIDGGAYKTPNLSLNEDEAYMVK